jgi:anti-sigma regulatory factor (Ser/Thr protein kinase)
MPLVWFLPAEPASVGLMRSRLNALLTALPQERLDDVLLATSELVTNAVLHGEGTVSVTLWPSRVVLRGDVTDDGPETPRPRQDRGEEDDAGRGLFIVDVISTRWGVVPTGPGPGKTVWFEIGEGLH